MHQRRLTWIAAAAWLTAINSEYFICSNASVCAYMENAAAADDILLCAVHSESVIDSPSLTRSVYFRAIFVMHIHIYFHYEMHSRNILAAPFFFFPSFALKRVRERRVCVCVWLWICEWLDMCTVGCLNIPQMNHWLSEWVTAYARTSSEQEREREKLKWNWKNDMRKVYVIPCTCDMSLPVPKKCVMCEWYAHTHKFDIIAAVEMCKVIFWGYGCINASLLLF